MKTIDILSPGVKIPRYRVGLININIKILIL